MPFKYLLPHSTRFWESFNLKNLSILILLPFSPLCLLDDKHSQLNKIITYKDLLDQVTYSPQNVLALETHSEWQIISVLDAVLLRSKGHP